jgi:phage-related holin
MLRLETRETLTGITVEAPFKAMIAVAGGALHWLFGSDLAPLLALLGLMFLDLITGIWVAARKADLSSSGYRRGGAKFFIYTIMLAGPALADKVFPQPFALAVMMWWLAGTELVSLLEHVAELGWPVPTALVARLRVMQERRSGPQKPVRE